jgi:hypothetical protein
MLTLQASVSARRASDLTCVDNACHLYLLDNAYEKCLTVVEVPAYKGYQDGPVEPATPPQAAVPPLTITSAKLPPMMAP